MPKSTQNDDTTFYIVDEELALLLPATRKAWENKLKRETITAYETPPQISARMKAVSYKRFPELQEKIDQYVADMQKGKATDFSLEDFPEEAVDSFLYSIGASGISAFIDMYLRSPDAQGNAEIMEAVAALSRARHTILEKNAAVFSD